MKKIILILFITSICHQVVHGQCPQGNPFTQFTNIPTTSSTISPPNCTLTPVTAQAASCLYNGQYIILMGLTIGETYQAGNCFAASIDGANPGTDITIRDGVTGNGAVLGFATSNTSGVCASFTAISTSATVQVNDTGCVGFAFAPNLCNSIDIQCTSCPVGPDPITPSGPCNNNAAALTAPSCDYAGMVADRGADPNTGLGGSVICGSNLPAVYPAQITGASSSCQFNGGGTGTTYGCLGGFIPNPSYFGFRSGSAGSLCLDLTNTNNIDLNFAVWGPIEDCDANLPGFQNGSGGLGAPTDCDNSPAPGGEINVCATAPNQNFVVVVSNPSGLATDIILNACSTPGSATFLCPPIFSTTPVVLTEFEGRVATYTNLLNWNTASEENALEFNVERSIDGKQFQQIGTVKAAGNSSSPTAYTFTDEHPIDGANYYRLNQRDIDGQEHLSNTIKVVRSGINGIKVYPNPIKNTMKVDLSLATSQLVDIQILDLSGRQINQHSFKGTQGLNHFEVPTNQLDKGTYFVKILKNNSSLEVIKINK